MVKKVIAAVVLIALLTVAIVQAVDKKTSEPQASTNQQAANTPEEGLKNGAKAPDFELKTLTGETVKLSDFRGKKVLLNFWATWCGPCKEEVPHLEKFSKEAGDDVVILAVNIDPQLDVKGFAKQYGITFPVLLDEDDHVNTTYKIVAIPTTYFINSKGIIESKFPGAMSEEQMKVYTSKLN